MAAKEFNIAGKTPQELGQELANHVAKGEYGVFVDYVRQLVDAGATLEEKDEKFGNTPLLSAAMNGHPDIAQLLFDKGANVNAVSKKGNGILHYTLPDPGMDRGTEEFYPIADMALARNIDVNLVNEMKQSALILAAKEYHRDYVQQLVDKGADLDQVDWERRTALQHAKTGSNGEPTAKVLQQAAIDRKRGAEVKAVQDLKEEVQLIVGVMNTGCAKPLSVPTTAKFKPRKIESV